MKEVTGRLCSCGLLLWVAIGSMACSGGGLESFKMDTEEEKPQKDVRTLDYGPLAAFPGAEGHGRETTGGRGGQVYAVTSLEDDNTIGTLRYGIERMRGARTIIFQTSGTIHLKNQLKIKNGDLTIAGQTAPGDGICLADYPFVIAADNVILRFLRFRVGNSVTLVDRAFEPDGLGGMGCKRVMVDHCSISWSIDECCSVYGCENSTVQWCIVSESLRNAGHSKGKHGYGGNWGGARASYHHNLMAHHESRVPRLGPRADTQDREYMDLRNNVFYNWAGHGCYGGEGMKVNIVNNYYKPGPATPLKKPVSYRIAQIGVRTQAYVKAVPASAPMLHQWGRFYVDGNVVEGNWEVTADNWTKGIYEQIDNSKCDNLFNEQVKKEIRLSAPLETGVVTTHTAKQAFKQVLLYAGCSYKRDLIDVRIVKETRNGTATYTGSVSEDADRLPGLIDTPNDVKPKGAASPWPELKADAPRLDTDGDGIPDEWEAAYNLNPNDASDGNKRDIDVHGQYTNLEMYMNSLVHEITSHQNDNSLK